MTQQQQLAGLLETLDQAIFGIDNNVTDPALLGLKQAQLTGLRQLRARAASVADATATPAAASPGHGPVTSFLGQPIKPKAQPVMPDQLTLGKTEAELFLERRDALYAGFGSMSDNEVLKVLTLPDGPALIRSVAKKAGLEDFQDAKLNIGYFMEVRRAIIEQAEKDTVVANATGTGNAQADLDNMNNEGADHDDDEETDEDKHDVTLPGAEGTAIPNQPRPDLDRGTPPAPDAPPAPEKPAKPAPAPKANNGKGSQKGNTTK